MGEPARKGQQKASRGRKLTESVPIDIGKPALLISASETAAIAGQHPYRNWKESLVKNIISYNPELYKIIAGARAYNEQVVQPALRVISKQLGPAAELPRSEEAPLEHLERLLTEHPELSEPLEHPELSEKPAVVDIQLISLEHAVQSVLDKVVVPPETMSESSHASDPAVCKFKDEQTKCAVDALIEPLAARAARFGESGWRRTRGIKLETGTLERLKAAGLDVQTCDVSKYLDLLVDGTLVRVLGRVDGIVSNPEPAIVEIKNRTSRFWLPDYDLDQLALYVAMWDYPKGLLVQQWQGKVQIRDYSRAELDPRVAQLAQCLGPAVALCNRIREDPNGLESLELGTLCVNPATDFA